MHSARLPIKFRNFKFVLSKFNTRSLCSTSLQSVQHYSADRRSITMKCWEISSLDTSLLKNHNIFTIWRAICISIRDTASLKTKAAAKLIAATNEQRCTKPLEELHAGLFQAEKKPTEFRINAHHRYASSSVALQNLCISQKIY